MGRSAIGRPAGRSIAAERTTVYRPSVTLNWRTRGGTIGIVQPVLRAARLRWEYCETLGGLSMTSRTATIAIICVVTTIALGLSVVWAMQSRQHATNSSYCWNSAYGGGFSWMRGEQHGYGWHNQHGAQKQCSTVYHTGGCGCGWCSSLDPDVRRDVPSSWYAHDGGCGCGWCTGAPIASSSDADSWWYAHGSGCGCAWCSTHAQDAPTDSPAWTAHEAACQCGWCLGQPAVDQQDDTATTRVHGHGCCCGWCTPASGPDAEDAASDKPARRGCGCGCC